MDGRFRDRVDAGRRLAERLTGRPELGDAVVLALPRGGVPVGREIADALGADLDVMVVRKLGVPGHEELAMGAIASGGVRIMNDEVLSMLYILGGRRRTRCGARASGAGAAGARVPRGTAGAAGAGPRRHPRRRRRGHGFDDPRRDRRAAPSGARAIVAAIPVAPPDVCEMLRHEADEVICLLTPEPFGAISIWYDSFPQLSDDNVRALLHRVGGERKVG